MVKIIVGALVLLGLMVAILIWTVIAASKQSDDLIAGHGQTQTISNLKPDRLHV